MVMVMAVSVRDDSGEYVGDGGDGSMRPLPELSSSSLWLFRSLVCCRQKLAAESAEAVKRENESALSVAAEGHAAAMKR